MQCPKCQAEVPEGHFYCSNCRVQVQTYEPETEKSFRGKFGRVGVYALNAAVWVLIIAALILVGRQAPWKELYAAIRAEMGVFEKVDSDSTAKTQPRAQSKAPKSAKSAQTDGKAGGTAKVAEASGQEKQEKNKSFESVRAMPQKIEELPSVQDQPQSQQSVEQVDAKNSDETALVINTNTPDRALLRIYVNGQFSGTAPRTIKLIPGDYQIRLIADGYEDWTRRVRLKNKQQVDLKASMKKIIPQKN